jgi:hypothetical protein
MKPSASRDNSTYKFQCALFLKLGSHYNVPIPLCCAFGIGVSTINTIYAPHLVAKFCLTYKTGLPIV